MIAATTRPADLFRVVLAILLFLFSVAPRSIAQTTVSTGSIVGTVSDPSGAVISGATITITNLASRQVVIVTNSSGGLLTGAAGQINGTTPQRHNLDRVGVGTGVYSLGAPRQIEFGLRLVF